MTHIEEHRHAEDREGRGSVTECVCVWVTRLHSPQLKCVQYRLIRLGSAISGQAVGKIRF